MSRWTYITGMIVVEPLGRTQHEKRYILDTVLDHLPNVTGSEKDMHVHVVQKAGHNQSQNSDEFGLMTDNLKNDYGDRSLKNGFMEMQTEYMVIVEGSFRDRYFSRTYREFQKWLCRLAKRVMVNDCIVIVRDDLGKSVHVTNENKTYTDMFEWPSWSRQNPDAPLGEPNWCEYLMWDHARDSELPMMLKRKYYADENNDAEVERRARYLYGAMK